MRSNRIERSRPQPLHIRHLQSGGLIVNYACSSSCMHCLYASSPRRETDYIDTETCTRLFHTSQRLGCPSLHIGGGEPFLFPDKLRVVLETARNAGMNIQYVETNSSWFRDADSARRTLEDLMNAGLSCLLVSISPFHNQFIPFYKVKGVISACRETGVSMFPWIMDFYQDIDSFPDDRPHVLSEYLEKFGPDYLKRVLRKYWIHPGGRVFDSFQSIYGKRRTGDLLTDKTGCIELTDTSHFHLDLYGNYIPALCSGIQIPHSDMGDPLNEQNYPYLHLLYNKGIHGLFHLASEEFGFQPRETYSSKCHLCLDIRRFLVMERRLPAAEFGPVDFYRELS
jgi:hypothetical protein